MWGGGVMLTHPIYIIIIFICHHSLAYNQIERERETEKTYKSNINKFILFFHFWWGGALYFKSGKVCHSLFLNNF